MEEELGRTECCWEDLRIKEKKNSKLDGYPYGISLGSHLLTLYVQVRVSCLHLNIKVLSAIMRTKKDTKNQERNPTGSFLNLFYDPSPGWMGDGGELRG